MVLVLSYWGERDEVGEELAQVRREHALERSEEKRKERKREMEQELSRSRGRDDGYGMGR